MPTLYQSDIAKRILPAPTGSESEVVSYRAICIPTAALAANDIIEIGPIPADHVLLDVVVDSDDLDTNGAPTLTLDCGFMSGTPGANDSARTVGNEVFAGSTIGQTGFSFTGGIQRLNKPQALRMLPNTVDKALGLKAAAGAATGVATLTNLNVNRGLWQAGTAYALNDFITLPTGVRMKCTTAGTSGTSNPFIGATIAAYNATTSDGTVTWTTADPVIGVTVLYRPAYRGA